MSRYGTYRVRIWKHFLNRYFAEVGTDQFLVEINLDQNTREVTHVRAYMHCGAAGEDFFNDCTLISKTVTVHYKEEEYPNRFWESVTWKALKQLYGDNPKIPKRTQKLKSPKWFDIRYTF